jgi:hypothetical protein
LDLVVDSEEAVEMCAGFEFSLDIVAEVEGAEGTTEQREPM